MGDAYPFQAYSERLKVYHHQIRNCSKTYIANISYQYIYNFMICARTGKYLHPGLWVLGKYSDINDIGNEKPSSLSIMVS
jgi:hypothetical protein